MIAARQDKQATLRSYIRELGTVAIAFSGGVDSSLLLYIAAQELGENAAAITVTSPLFPQREIKSAVALVTNFGITHYIVGCDVLSIEGFASNPPDRCYLCKHALLTTVRKTAIERGFSNLAEGSNLDDEADYRPGMLAIGELGVLSPLRAVGLTKAEIRDISRQLGLPTWDQDSFACLASRLPYGESITLPALKRIELAEQFLIDLGCRQVRVRCHGNNARIECDPGGFELICKPETRECVDEALRSLGFNFVALDLRGYRTGSMNAILTK